MNQTQPIGIFDSGVGGLSLANCINQHLPNEQLYYLADQLHLPYGTKTSEFLTQRALEVSHQLMQLGVKAIVVACNTATSNTISVLRDHLDCPIFGIEPGLKPASEQSLSNRVGVMATTQTINSSSFKLLLSRFEKNTDFFCQPCPGLAHSIETKGIHPDTMTILEKYLGPLLDNNIDTLVLGCTHYAHIYQEILDFVGEKIQVIEPSQAVVKHIKRTLNDLNLLNSIQNFKTDIFLSSHLQTNSTQLIQSLWKDDIEFKSFD